MAADTEGGADDDNAGGSGQPAAPSASPPAAKATHAPSEQEGRAFFEQLFDDYCADVSEAPIFGNHELYVVRIIKHFALVYEFLGEERAQRDKQAFWDSLITHVKALDTTEEEQEQQHTDHVPRLRPLRKWTAQLAVLFRRLHHANETVDVQAAAAAAAAAAGSQDGRVVVDTDEKQGGNAWQGFREQDITSAVALFVKDTRFIPTLEHALFARFEGKDMQPYQLLSEFGAEATDDWQASDRANQPGMLLTARVLQHSLEQALPRQNADADVLGDTLDSWLPLLPTWLNANGERLLNDAFALPAAHNKSNGVQPGPLATAAGISSPQISKARWEFWKTRLRDIRKANANADARDVALVVHVEKVLDTMNELETYYREEVDKKSFKKPGGKCCTIL